MQVLTIGKLASAAGVGVETVRFYERKGLIAAPPRRRSGYRQYPPDTVRRLRFIRHAKELGFTLGEIAELLSMRVDAAMTCAEVRGLARAKISDIDDRIAALQSMRAALEVLARRCRGAGPTTQCPILDAIDLGGSRADG